MEAATTGRDPSDGGRGGGAGSSWVRVLTGLLLLPLVAVIYFAPPVVCLILFCIGAVLAYLELSRFLEALELVPVRLVGILLTLGLVGSFYLPVWGAGLVLAVAIAALPGAWAARRLPAEAAFPSLAGNLFAVVLAGVFMGYQVALRLETGPQGETIGAGLLVFLYATVFAGDTLALYTGKLLGRHLMAPRVSPKKTWEGLGGNLAGNLLGAWAASNLLPSGLHGSHVVAMALLVGLAGVGGDLSISLLKRSVGMKDTGSLLPGHGGILDRLDSLVLSAPVLFYYVKYAVFFSA